jgi:hypothetical protein
MNREETLCALNFIAKCDEEWRTARREYDKERRKVVTRLLNEAAVNFLSTSDVAKALGTTVKKVCATMRENGLDHRRGRGILAKQAAKTLNENAALLGVSPRHMDLTSPLAYLPAGSKLRAAAQSEAVRNGVDIDRREALAAAIYGNGRCPSWYSTMDDTPNSTSYELADRILGAGL